MPEKVKLLLFGPKKKRNQLKDVTFLMIMSVLLLLNSPKTQSSNCFGKQFDLPIVPIYRHAISPCIEPLKERHWLKNTNTPKWWYRRGVTASTAITDGLLQNNKDPSRRVVDSASKLLYHPTVAYLRRPE